MGSRSVENVRLNGYIRNIWINEISVEFNFFVGIFVFIKIVFFRWKILLQVVAANYISWLNYIALYFCDANFIVYGIFLCF